MYSLVVVGWFGIIQVTTNHWIVGAGMLTLGFNFPGVIGLMQALFDVKREKVTVYDAFRYIFQLQAYTITVSSELNKKII